MELHEAMLYDKMPNKLVHCKLCNRRCMIAPGQRGQCRVRENQNGTLYSMNYAKAVSFGTDPIEKKPFYHFFPGSQSFSIATAGCNFKCLWCQNWEISQFRPEDVPHTLLPPERVVQMAADTAQGVAYTYTEPTIFFEWAYDCAKLARKKGLYNVFVTNAYMTPETIELMGNIDAANPDIKGFNEKVYMDGCGGIKLELVLDSTKRLAKRMHVEIVNLIIPNWNDNRDELRQLSQWVYDNLGKDTPIHFTAFYPAYKLMEEPPTPVETLEFARKTAQDIGLRYVYSGNVPGHPGENTYCWKCSTMLIERSGFEVIKNSLAKGNKCPECGAKIAIVDKIGD